LSSPLQPSKKTFEAAPVMDSLLTQELAEAQERIEKLEILNRNLVRRSSQLENDLREHAKSREELHNKLSRLELEKRMAVMEAENATKIMQEKAASLEEMQMEIDLVTKASHSANVRAAAGEQIIKTVKTDKEYVQKLESQVKVLQEWAVASNEAKTLAQERARMLENQLKALQRPDIVPTSFSSEERMILNKKGSFVVGAGDIGVRVFTLDADMVKAVKLSERIVLRWTFDLVNEDLDIVFSIARGCCETSAKQKNANFIIKERKVKGGAGGETDDAFTVDRSCTLLWSNTQSWIRPRTVKYTVEAVVLQA
jgi:hypothetical protein